MVRLGVFPGSFNPPTIAHLLLAEEARRRFDLNRVDLVVSRRALAKEQVDHPRLEHRIEVLRASVADHARLNIVVTDRQLLADIADGYHLLIMGADKWWQIRQLKWYASTRHRDQSLAALPEVAVFPRDGHDDPPEVARLTDAGHLTAVSSTRARAGEIDLMTAAARAFAERTGAWIDVERYERWLADGGPAAG